jgi:hypothetical protein
VESSADWGGELELRALADAMKAGPVGKGSFRYGKTHMDFDGFRWIENGFQYVKI